MPIKLETSLKNIQFLDNPNNAKLIYNFYLYLRSVNTSESYQNQNSKALINMARFFGKDVNLVHLTKKEDILSFLDSKIKSKEDDPDGKWMRTWNDYLQRIKYFFRWFYNEKLRPEKNEELLDPSDLVASSFLKIEDIDNKEGMAALHNAIANLLLNRKECNDALKNYNKALSIHLKLYSVSNSNDSSSGSKNDDIEIAYDSNGDDYVQAVISDYINIGLTLGHLKDYQKAIEYYAKVLKISPNDVTVIDNKGYALSNLEKYDEAIKLATRAIELDPTYTNAWYNKAGYYARTNRIDESITDLREAISLDERYGHDALADKDFDNIRDNPKFVELLKRFR